MSKRYRVYQKLDLPETAREILHSWEREKVFERSISEREGRPSFVFYEGPPSANGKPGIHHVMARAIKDIFCRYKTLKGYQVLRKAGWDTHGLPVELGVEKELGITKEDIGKSISIEEYNEACKSSVMRYTDIWNDLTHQMGYWVDMEDPYVTYEPKYMETVWFLLKRIYDKGLLYKGFTIQPYSPKAGTGLSSHELNMPGTYRDVKDTSVTAQFKVVADGRASDLLGEHVDQAYFLAWTTTPWTLPSNTALTVGKKISYSLVETWNQYTHEAIKVILATELIAKQFTGRYVALEEGMEFAYNEGDKKIPYRTIATYTGEALLGIRYEQLLPFTLPMDDADQAFRVIPGDFVTTEDGTGIVHTAPTFGADDAKVAKDAGVPPMLVDDGQGSPIPLVDLQGKFVDQMGPYAGKYVKNEYYPQGEEPELSVDIELSIQLKKENKAFKVEKYEHSYPHCWRTDKPVLYYPLDSWFIRTTEVKERMIELNNSINWKPASTGTGRFGNWLENLNDWNLSRSRYWGIPIPIWRTEDGSEERCIGSVEELKEAIDESVRVGFMKKNPLNDFVVGDMSESNYALVDLHKHLMDKVVLVSPSGFPMTREADLIDVWFDSGSMPYAQLHYPFENKDLVDSGKYFPADFIAEGVDQTRGWFFTLHAIGTMCFDQVAFKNVVSNGLVLDKNGQKMSKRLGNAVDPFQTLDKYGADATRWYMISNAQPWDNLRFDLEGLAEVQRKFFGTLYNTYAFFSLYANIDGFKYQEKEIPLEERPEIDRWILSELNSLIEKVDASYEDYEPTRAARAISYFVTDHLSNWYVRLCRRRFWKGEYETDKISAYQTLYDCLLTIAKLMSPIAPFYADQLYTDLNSVSEKETSGSVHLSQFPSPKKELIDVELEERMELAQSVTSLILSLRKKEKIRVRQPLARIMIPVKDDHFAAQLSMVENLIKSEVNVKDIQRLDESSNVLVKTIKPNFKALGPKYGKLMKLISAEVGKMVQEDIAQLENTGAFEIAVQDERIELSLGDVDIQSKDIPGWQVASADGLTVALDVTISEELRKEGVARELVNRIQNIRKDKGLEVTDQIVLNIQKEKFVEESVTDNFDYICSETLAVKLNLEDNITSGTSVEFDEIKTLIEVIKA